MYFQTQNPPSNSHFHPHLRPFFLWKQNRLLTHCSCERFFLHSSPHCSQGFHQLLCSQPAEWRCQWENSAHTATKVKWLANWVYHYSIPGCEGNCHHLGFNTSCLIASICSWKRKVWCNVCWSSVAQHFYKLLIDSYYRRRRDWSGKIGAHNKACLASRGWDPLVVRLALSGATNWREGKTISQDRTPFKKHLRISIPEVITLLSPLSPLPAPLPHCTSRHWTQY